MSAQSEGVECTLGVGEQILGHEWERAVLHCQCKSLRVWFLSRWAYSSFRCRGAEAPRWRSVMYDAGKNAFVVRLSDGSIGAVISVDCVFAGIDLDPMTYSVVLKMLDGSELKFSLRGLFEQFFHEVMGR
jgi:hypothetical protein